MPFSVAAPAVDKLPRFRTMENDPTLHNESHIGKFYTMPQNMKEKLFLTGGIPKRVAIQMETFQECSIMVRGPAVEAISYMRQFNYKCPALRIVLYGANGTGKTLSLAHLVHYGYSSKHLLLHIPWVSDWTKRPKESVPSVSRPGRIDLPLVSTAWLQHFRLQNQILLQELDLKASQKYTWSEREVTEEGQPLIDVLMHGLTRGPHASDCIAVLLKEIKLQSKSGKFRTMVIIDGVNAFYSKTNIRRLDKSLVKATDVTVVRAFEKMLKNDWNNAVIIVSVDTIPANREEALTLPFTPRSLLGKEGFEILDPFIPICVQNYTDKEIESVIDYYTDRLWLQHEDASTEKGRAELKFLSGHNGFDLMKICDPL